MSKRRKAILACFDRSFKDLIELFRENPETRVQDLPKLIACVTPKISSEKDLLQDNLEILINAGKTAYEISEHVSLGFRISLPLPIINNKVKDNKSKLSRNTVTISKKKK